MHYPRFFVPDMSEQGTLWLDENESRHAVAVLRCQLGDHLLAFDGQGGERLCRISAITKKKVELECIAGLDTDRELARPLILIVALPKGDRQKTLIEMATQIGVSALVPLETTRGVAQPTRDSVIRLQRTVIEASKQCGRNRLMEILPPTNVDRLSTDARWQTPFHAKWIAHPYDESEQWSPATADRPPPTSPIAIAVGPEGGFTRDEVQRLIQCDWHRISLGKSILRVETAAVALAAWAARIMLDQIV